MYERQEENKQRVSSYSHKQLEQNINDLTFVDSDEVKSERELRNACMIGLLFTFH